MTDLINNSGCWVCDKIKDPAFIIRKNDYAVAILDSYPVTRFHTLIVPIQHRETYFDLSIAEKQAIDHIIGLLSLDMTDKDDITGFNIGWNCGESAGQTVYHAHCHLIPRRDGDVDDPVGGIRGIIPEKRNYLK